MVILSNNRIFRVHAFALIYPGVHHDLCNKTQKQDFLLSPWMKAEPSIGRPVKTYPQKFKLKIREKIGPAQPQQL
jgi:hypothetical protein